MRQETHKTRAGATVTVKWGKTVLGKANTDKKENFTVKIKAQKAGAILAVTAKAAETKLVKSQTSKTAIVKIKLKVKVKAIRSCHKT
ncbi:Ig-like domain-containing protein [Numidum massiliense]|uniref:Ig-like domain-containing protein n=1 Tax=Numidum massiliense TaxID=1522315 RepID=UPI0011CBD5BB|nr:Ig-like domain-containing protein [Numidum massiliense]